MTDVPLREYLEALLRSELAARDRALELQAAELARRLDELNHAHERAVEERTSFIRQDVYDQRHSDLERRLGVVGERFFVLEKWRANLAGRTAGIGVLLAIAVAIVTALLTHLIA